MNLPASGNLYEMASCTKTVSIKTGDSVVQLKQGRVVVINGKDVDKLPIRFCDMKISIVSSLFLKGITYTLNMYKQIKITNFSDN